MVDSNTDDNEQPKGDMGKGNNYQGSNIIIGSTAKEIRQNVNNYHDVFETYNVLGLESPYPGLVSYEEENSSIYAGREQQIAAARKLLTKPGEQRAFLFIIGVSGCGKSSLMKAGIIPDVVDYYVKRNYAVQQAVFNPSSFPRDQFHHAAHGWKPGFELGWTIQRYFAELAHTTDRQCVHIIGIDQFEELWGQSNPEQRDDLLAALEHLPAFENARTHVVISLRSEFIGQLFKYRALYAHLDPTLSINLRAMDSEDLKKAIQRPLQATFANKVWEPLLLENIARVAAKKDDALPIVQVLIKRIWKSQQLWIKDPIDFDQVMDDFAEKVLDDFNSDEQERIMRLVLELVRVTDDKEQPATRQWRSTAALCARDAARGPLIIALVQKRLLSSKSEQRDDETVPVVTVIHDSLLYQWGRLKKAIDDNREYIQYRSNLERLFERWAKSEKSSKYLLANIDLEQARELHGNDDIIFRDRDEFRRFYINSVEQERKSLTRRVQMWSVLSLALGVLLLVAVIFLYPRVKAWRYRNTIGTEFAPIPSGQFTYARRSMTLNAFQLERYEVSQSQYRVCVEYGPCDRPINRSLYDNPGFDSRPMVHLSAQMAAEYCAWIGRRLPTTIEWERAVHGTIGRLWPWGDDDPTQQRANVGTSGVSDFTKALPVATPLEGVTPEGIEHLIGNVAELTVEPSPDCATAPAACHRAWDGVSPHPMRRVGGHYRAARSTAILRPDPVAPTDTSEFTGFRCADNP